MHRGHDLETAQAESAPDASDWRVVPADCARRKILGPERVALRHGMPAIQLLDQRTIVRDERVDRRLAFRGGRQLRGGRLVHHVPQRDPVVTRMGRHDGRCVLVRLGPPPRRHPIRARIGDPDVTALQTGRHAEARIEQEAHDLQPVLGGGGHATRTLDRLSSTDQGSSRAN